MPAFASEQELRRYFHQLAEKQKRVRRAAANQAASSADAALVERGVSRGAACEGKRSRKAG